MGGGSLFRSLLDVGQVDTVEVAVVPVLLGEGVPLLRPGDLRRVKFERHTVYPKRRRTVLLEYPTV